MLRMLTLLGTVAAAWALSQYLPSKDASRHGHTAAAIATRTIVVPESQPAARHSVALLDLAVSAFPVASSDRTAEDFGPAPLPASSQPAPAAAGSLAEPAEAETAALEVAPSEAVAEPAEDPKLTRKIQRELRRVGCLKSAADGVWGSGTERAMRRFSERIEADLPVDGPDVVLLILLEKFDNRACGAPCPAGEAPNTKGRCRAVEQTAEAIPAEDTIAEARIAALAAEDSPELAEEASAEITGFANSEDAAAKPVSSARGKPQRAKVRIARTTVARVAKSKRVRIARAVPQRRKTRWALPRYYGLGVASAKPARVASAPKKRKRRTGAAAYRRWMRRSDITMR